VEILRKWSLGEGRGLLLSLLLLLRGNGRILFGAELGLVVALEWSSHRRG
jgi:hypothetical protein